MEKHRQGHRRGVGATPAQSCNVSGLVHALESSHQDNFVPVQLLENPVIAQPQNSGISVGAVGVDAGLPAGERNHRISHGLDGHSQEARRDLLPGGEVRIHFPSGDPWMNGYGLSNHIVCSLTLGGDHSHHPAAPLGRLGDDAGRSENTLPPLQGGPSEFLHNQHGITSIRQPLLSHGILCSCGLS